MKLESSFRNDAVGNTIPRCALFRGTGTSPRENVMGIYGLSKRNTG